MVNLSKPDRLKLVRLFEQMPEFQSLSSRQQLLVDADLKDVMTRIQLEGTVSTVVREIISRLSQIGRVSYGPETLGMLLNTIKDQQLVEDTEFINRLLIDYNMMTPIITLPKLGVWKGKDTGEAMLEKIVGENTLRPIAFLAQALKLARSVAKLEVNNRVGTGFLVAPDLLLTNQHVLPDADARAKTTCQFNYELDFEKRAYPVTSVSPRADGLFHANANLDYALVQLDGRPGDIWGWVPLKPGVVRSDERVNIIQHPGGQPKKISLQSNFVEFVGDGLVQYTTATQPGSSGAPVFNDDWQIVALHHSGGMMIRPGADRKYYCNEGIAIKAILADLPVELQQLVNVAA